MVQVKCPKCGHAQKLRSRTILKLKTRGKKTLWCSECKYKFKVVIS